MAKFVPYLADEMIEGDAALLLAEYAHARGIVIAPPIPIEDIVEKYLKLGIEFDDTHKLFRRAAFGPRTRHPCCNFLRRSAHRDRREPRSRGKPGEGRPLSFHARS